MTSFNLLIKLTIPFLDILLVEDNQMTCMALTRFLSARLGHSVTTAASKCQAEVAIREKKFDLIFCDLGLPDGTGFDLLSVIQVGPFPLVPLLPIFPNPATILHFSQSTYTITPLHSFHFCPRLSGSTT
jgi:DNA-binding NarL/FixJ family response regulator